MVVIIVNERLRKADWLMKGLDFLSGNQLKYVASSNNYDLLCPAEGSGHLCIALFDSSETVPEAAARLNGLQRVFKNAIAVGDVAGGGEDEWALLNLQLSAASRNCLRFIRVQQLDKIPGVVSRVVKELTATKKLEMQVEFFRREEEKNASASASALVAQSLFAQLGVSREDGAIIMDCCGSLAQLMKMDWSALISSIPVDEAVLWVVFSFFQPAPAPVPGPA